MAKNTSNPKSFAAITREEGDDNAILPHDDDTIPLPHTPSPPRKIEATRSVLQVIRQHDVDAMTIEMAGLLQENVNQGQEELSSDDDMDQEEKEVWEEEEEDSGDKMETMEMMWILGQVVQNREHPAHGFVTNFGSMLLMPRRTSSHLRKRKKRRCVFSNY